MKTYIKHTVECNCVLPQYAKLNPATFHQFIVFSVINNDGEIIPAFAKCNNCNAIHKVTEVGISETLAKEDISLLPKINEIKLNIPEQIIALVESYNLDIPTWQEISFIVENKLWGKPVILSKEEDDGKTIGKFLLILGKSLFKIDSYNTTEEETEGTNE